VAKVAHELRPDLEKRSLTWQQDLADDLSPIQSDPTRVEQIIHNLVSNAVKFTPAGSVTVTVRPAGRGGVAITVADTGIGIRAEHLPQLFEAFRQVDGSARRVYDGVGLGLNLVRKLAAKL